MIDIMPDDKEIKEISKALNVLNSISDTLRYEKICEISEAQKNTYKELLEKFKQLHDISLTDNAPKNLHNLKGEALVIYRITEIRVLMVNHIQYILLAICSYGFLAAYNSWCYISIRLILSISVRNCCLECACSGVTAKKVALFDLILIVI